LRWKFVGAGARAPAAGPLPKDEKRQSGRCLYQSYVDRSRAERDHQPGRAHALDERADIRDNIGDKKIAKYGARNGRQRLNVDRADESTMCRPIKPVILSFDGNCHTRSNGDRVRVLQLGSTEMRSTNRQRGQFEYRLTPSNAKSFPPPD
jgi:hypothetical protein